jgi:hypothetical protein
VEKLTLLNVGLLVLVYGGSGIAEIFQWRKFASQFERWRFPAWMAWGNPLLKIAAAALVMMPATRAVGAALCLTVAAGAVFTVLRFRERGMYKAAFPVAVLTVVSATYLIW